MALGSAIPAAFAATQAPSDVTSSTQYAGAIDTLVTMGTLNLYSDGTFRADLGVSRGQFIAYVYNILNAQGVITNHYTQKAQPYSDENNYFRNQINDMYLYGFLNNVDLGNGAIGQNYKTPAWWAAEVLANVANINYDSSKPYNAMNQARAKGWFDNTPDKSANPDYYLSRGEMAQILENFYAAQYPSAFKGVPTSLTLTAKDATIAQGTADQLTVGGTDMSGAAVTVDPTQVTYAVTDAKGNASTSGFVNGSGLFTATAPGTYTVTATYGAFSASTQVSVFSSTPASLNVTAAGNLVKDYVNSSTFSTQTVAVKVYDQAGNVVQNYNGPVTLSSGTTTDATVETATVNAVNGVATFKLDAAATATAGDKVTLTATIPNPNLTGTGTIGIDAPQASSFNVGYASGAAQGLSVNVDGGSTTLLVTALDQAGVTDTNLNQYVTATISGPGTFAGGLTTQQLWIGGGNGQLVVQGKQGVAGNVVVTISSTGLQSASFTVPAYVQTPTASVAGSISGSIAEGATGTLSVKALDTQGNLALGESGTVTVTGIPSGVTVNGLNNNGTATLSLAKGVASVTVADTNYIGTGTLTLQYTVGSTTVSTTVPVTFTQGGASQLASTTAWNGEYFPANSTQTLSFQLEDASGAAMKVSGDTFTVVLPSALGTFADGTNTASVTTDANGQFSVTIKTPNYVGTPASGTVTVNENGSTTGVGALNLSLNVNNQWNLAQTVTGQVYDAKTADSKTTTIANVSQLAEGASVTAGDKVYLDVYGIDGTNGAHAGDTYSVTSSNSSIVSLGGLDANGNITGLSGGVPNSTGTSNTNLTLQGGLAGTAVITITDTSVVSQPKVSFTVSVVPQGKIQKISLTGINVSSSPTTVVPGQSYPVTIRLTDLGGNQAYGTGTVTVNLSDTSGLTNFRNAAGAAISSVQIDEAVGSATVYWVAPALAANTQITLSATDAASSLSAGSLGTLQIQ
jgi:hypothetical protein